MVTSPVLLRSVPPPTTLAASDGAPASRSGPHLLGTHRRCLRRHPRCTAPTPCLARSGSSYHAGIHGDDVPGQNPGCPSSAIIEPVLVGARPRQLGHRPDSRTPRPVPSTTAHPTSHKSTLTAAQSSIGLALIWAYRCPSGTFPNRYPAKGQIFSASSDVLFHTP